LKEKSSLPPETGHHGAGHPTGGYEKSDAGVHSAGILGGAFVILLIFGLVTGYLAFRFFNSPETVGPPASPLSSARVIPNGPRLQVNGHEDLLDYLHQQEHALDSYGWVHQKAGVVRVPIDQAMEMVLKRGLPVRGTEPQGRAGASAEKPTANLAKPAVAPPAAGQ
jgi:hypothetical protein